MGYNDFVDVEPIVLFRKAEKNIAAINSLLKDNDVSEDVHYDSICFNITQAVEKYLKGFIILNNEKVKEIHSLDKINKIAIKINDRFNEIHTDCLKLDNYDSDLRYDDRIKIEKHELKELLNILKRIYHFEPIKIIREEFIKTGNYIILPEYDFIKEIKND